MRVELPALHSGQREVYDHPARFKVVVAGRRWRKTSLGVVTSLARALTGKRTWWVAPTHAQASIAWRLVRALATRVPGVVVREAERAIYFPGGGEFWCKSGDRYDNLRGIGLDYVVLDEADFQPRAVWEEILRPACADRRGGALFISTPAVERGWFHELFERGQGGAHPEWRSWQFPSWSNPHLDAREIEAARSTMPSIVFRREFGAEFVSSAGARVRREWLRFEPPPRSGLTVVLGTDLAVSQKSSADWSAWVALGRAPDGVTYALGAERTRQPFHGVVQFIKRAAEGWDPSAVVVEDVAMQRGVITELMRTSSLPIRAVRPQGDKLARFTPCEGRIEQGLLRFAPGLPPEFIDELLSFPVGGHDDFCDAMAYALAALSDLEAYDRGPVVEIDPRTCVETRSRWGGYGGRGWGG